MHYAYCGALVRHVESVMESVSVTMPTFADEHAVEHDVKVVCRTVWSADADPRMTRSVAPSTRIMVGRSSRREGQRRKAGHLVMEGSGMRWWVTLSVASGRGWACTLVWRVGGRGN